VLGLGLAGPVWAGTAATLTVSARVVERCAVQLPDQVPDQVWPGPPLAALPAAARARLAALLEHRCAPRTPAQVHIAPGPPPGIPGRHETVVPGPPPGVAGWRGPAVPPAAGPPGRALVAPRGPNHVLVTITY
jgi:hypothetical protein